MVDAVGYLGKNIRIVHELSARDRVHPMYGCSCEVLKYWANGPNSFLVRAVKLRRFCLHVFFHIQDFRKEEKSVHPP